MARHFPEFHFIVNYASLGAAEFVESSWFDKLGHLPLQASLHLSMTREQAQVAFLLPQSSSPASNCEYTSEVRRPVSDRVVAKLKQVLGGDLHPRSTLGESNEGLKSMILCRIRNQACTRVRDELSTPRADASGPEVYLT